MADNPQSDHSSSKEDSPMCGQISEPLDPMKPSEFFTIIDRDSATDDDTSPFVDHDLETDEALDKIFRHFRKHEKTAILIDGANTHQAVRDLDFNIDYRRFKSVFDHYATIDSIYFFTAIANRSDITPTMSTKAVKATVDWMSYNGGFRCVFKPVKEITLDNGVKFLKGNMDVELAVTAALYCSSADHIVLVTGDGDFRFLVEALQKEEKRVTVISTKMTNPRIVADELWRQADQFIDLEMIRDHIKRESRRDESKST
jgi:uncharacterized LabA/DUF88 family protein